MLLVVCAPLTPLTNAVMRMLGHVKISTGSVRDPLLTGNTTRPRTSVARCIFTLIGAVFVLQTAHAEEGFIPTRNLNLPIVEVRETYLPYTSFCRRNPGHCEMVGPTIIDLTEELRQILSEVNAAVNASINVTISDKELYDQEEHWTYPSGGYGDCEDIALEKRRRLVERGLPRAAMTMAIVHHKRTLMSHAVLLIEMTSGTYLLDSFTDKIVIWSKAPFNYESRERVDETWERYDQSLWTYEKPVVPRSDGGSLGSW